MIGRIYKISSPNSDKIYIGSTTRTLHERFIKHKNKKDSTSKIIFEFGEPNIELLEEVQVSCKDDLRQIENKYIIQFRDICVNKYSAFGQDEEKKKQTSKIYRKKTTERKKESSKIRYEKLKKIIINCICGSVFNKHDEKRHYKSIKHQNYIISTNK
jgi:hypothetical protein